jgi:predicted permease
VIAGIRHRLRALFRRGEVESELEDELQFHVEQATAAHVRAGHTPEEAARLARLELGGLEAVKEDCRDARGVRLLYDFGTDVRYGLRVLRKSPAFTVVAILTLALGIGANTAMFAIVDDVLLHPVPYERPAQLVRLHASKPSFERGSISYPNFIDWQAGNRSFSSIAVSRSAAFTLTGAGSAERVSGELISPDYFTVLAVAPLAGHAFATDDAIALLGERLWRRKFAASPDIVGRTIVLDGQSYVVAGVMPARADLRAVSGGPPVDVYVPITQRDREVLKLRAAGLGIHGIARLKPGVTIEQARADMAAVTTHLAERYPETNKSVGATIDPLEEAIVGNLRPYLLVLFAAVGLVLLIACVNVANLLLARSAVRSHELAIRAAVGASFGRVIRQLLTESLLLAVAGGACGLLVAWWSTDALLAFLPGRLSRVAAHSLDPSVLAFTAGVTLLAGVLAGLLPALKAIRPNLYDTIKEGGRGHSTRSRPQAVFVVLQTGLAVVLLVGAGLLVRTMARLSTIDPGYEPSGVVTFGLSLSPQMQAAPTAAIRTALQDLEGALATTPGVDAASFAFDSVPVEGGDQWLFWVDGRPKPQSDDQMSWAVASIVGPGYLESMRIPLLRGRFFTERDDEHVPYAVVIDDVFARMHFPGEDPIGKRLHFGDEDSAEIVGVVGHVRMWGLDQDESTTVRAQLYIPFRQLGDPMVAKAAAGAVVVARVRGDGAVAALRSTIERHGAENVMFRLRTAGEIITSYQTTRRFAMYVLAAFAALALLLSCVGIYGVISYVVARRTAELGIRMALGATAHTIMRMVLGEGLKLTLIGVVLGLGAACLLTRFMTGMLYGVPPIDPITFAAVAAGVTLVALVSLVLPARRAMRVEVMQALRAD